MKILIVTPRFLPEPFSIGPIAKKLKEFGNEVVVLTGRPNYGLFKAYKGYEKYKKDDFIDGIRIIRIKEKIRKNGVFSLVLNYLSVYFGFKKYLKSTKENFDVVLSHALSPLFALDYVGKFCKKRNIKNMIYGLDLWPASFVSTSTTKRNSMLYRIIKKYAIKLYNNSDLISYASPSCEKYIKEYLNVDKPFVHIYQPCLTETPLLEKIENHTYKKDGKIHILYCGTIAKFNHLSLFIRALDDPSIKNKIIFDVVGSGSDLENVVDLTKKLNLEETVFFHGRKPVNDVKQYYFDADILFIPLYCNSETSLMIPQKVPECLMYGRPILGMIQGDGRDLIQKASPFNYLCDQTVDDLNVKIKIIINDCLDNFKKCGKENRLYFDKNNNFKLETISNEINDLLFKITLKQ